MRFHRQSGFSRIAILLFLLLVCAAGGVFVNFNSIVSSMPATKTAQAVDLTGPARRRGNVIWLAENTGKSPFYFSGLTIREIFRQSLLIAARDEMGLQTRDASLREWRGAPPSQDSLVMEFNDHDIKLSDVEEPAYVRWHKVYTEGAALPDNLTLIAGIAEKMSRKDFVSALHKAGWSGSANVIKANASPPPDADARLGEMEELSQFAVLRETHAVIRADGESQQRLGVLVRAYANLGQLTRYHWSQEFAVYSARSLLYAQRMVANDPNSAFALWHRAYASAMVGLQKDALDDLAAAGKLKSDNAPAWVALLEPFCNYQTGKLVDLSNSDKTIEPLAMYLAFLSVEHCGSQGATMNLAQSAFAVNPRCLRLVDAMCGLTGPGMLNELSQTGPQIFSKTLGDRWEKMPSFPRPLIDQIESLKRPGGNPAGREQICQALIDAGAPERDAVEPSWAALGRLVQETTFAHVQLMANLISEQWGVDASDYVSQSQPLVADHPFKFIIDTYGIRHTADIETLRQSIKVPPAALLESTMRQLPLYNLYSWILPDGPNSGNLYWNQIVRNSDCTSFDLEKIVGIEEWTPANAAWLTEIVENLRRHTPQSPIVMAADIRRHWDAAKAGEWESEHGDYPTVALALGEKYTELKRWTDAERCLRQYIAVAPDKQGYEALATVYKNQGKDDRWLSTLNDYLANGRDYGLQNAQVQVEIANYYMRKLDYESALPYATDAAATGAGWAMLCEADALTGLGNFDGAEQLYVEDVSHYSDYNPVKWYDWCTSTGHGDIATAMRKTIDYYVNQGDNVDKTDLMNLGCLYLGQNKSLEALAVFQRRMKLFPGPVSALHIAIIDDKLHENSARDAVLDQIQTLPDHDSVYGQFAALLRSTCKSGESAIPDPAAVNAIIKRADFVGEIAICALVAQFAEDHGHLPESISYLKRCVEVNGYTEERMWVNLSLRKKGIDPWPIQTAARQRQVAADSKSKTQ
jgi:tetratricopeptide (TPR) repeat protein